MPWVSSYSPAAKGAPREDSGPPAPHPHLLRGGGPSIKYRTLGGPKGPPPPPWVDHRPGQGLLVAAVGGVVTPKIHTLWY